MLLSICDHTTLQFLVHLLTVKNPLADQTLRKQYSHEYHSNFDDRIRPQLEPYKVYSELSHGNPSVNLLKVSSDE